MFKKFLSSTLLVFCISTVSANDDKKADTLLVKPFSASYNLIRDTDPLGVGTRKLSYAEDGSAQYSYHTDLEWLIFSDTREETSHLNINNSSGTVTPIGYEFKREGTGRDKHYQWTFNIANNQATDIKENKTINVDYPDNIQDKLSYHLQQRINLIKNPEQKLFVYPVIGTSSSIKNYVYEFDSIEEVMLPYGLVKAIKLKREVVEKKKVTYVWFAPELNYLLVKLYQEKAGVKQFEAQLTEVNIENE